MSNWIRRLDQSGDAFLPLAARLVFASVLFGYFMASAMTKFDGPFTPSLDAYAQIFPKAFEQAGYDSRNLSIFHWAVVMAGAYAEVLLPLLLVIGLATRIAAFGMIGFIVVQSATDVFGHMASPATIGAWFDRASDSLILDQRSFWVLLLLILVLKGAGALSFDRFFASRLKK